MNIIEATKLITGTEKHIRRKSWVSGLELGLTSYDAYKFHRKDQPNDNSNTGLWNPLLDDITANDWEISE